MELEIKQITMPEKIECNYEELKQWIAERSAEYASIVYTDDDIQQAKNDRANLNRLKNALNDRRIQIEKEYMQPFQEFKSQINELIKLIDEPARLIDQRIKEYEKAKQDEKAKKIEEAFLAMEDRPDWVEIGMIWDKKWLNASKSMKSILEEISERIQKINSDLHTLSTLKDFGFEATEEYKRSLDINRAMSEGMRLADIQRRKEEEEARRAEEERQRQAQEQLRRERMEEQVRLVQEKQENPDGFYVEQEPKPQWVSFQALITAQQGRALKQFCDANGIQIRPI